MTSTSSLRLALRLARRETLRRPWRTVLVALLVAVPVAGMVVGSAFVRTAHRSPLEEWRAQQGNADLSASESIDDVLPPGSRTVSYRTDYRLLATVGGERTRAEVTDLPMSDAMTAPMVHVAEGRAPERAGEVFVTRAVARHLDVDVGDVLRLRRPPAAEWTVVGIGERRAWWGAETVVLGPGTAFPWRDARGTSAMLRFGPSATTTVLADLPAGVTADQLRELPTRVAGGVSFAPGFLDERVPQPLLPNDDDPGSKVAWTWVFGAIALTVAGIVIAAAFAAGARRQLTTLGQLAANGAAPGVLRRVLFLQGTWTGIAGTVGGFGFAAVALWALSPYADRFVGHDVDPYTMRAADLVPIVLLGIVAATVAALIPARTTARIPVLAALAGRRPLQPVPRWLTVAGVATGGAGLALLGLAIVGADDATDSGTVWVLTAIVGGMGVLFGACAVAPGYVSVLEPVGARLSGASRLAARSLARQRTRTSAVVSAVCAASALAIAASALVLSAEEQARREPDWVRADEVELLATSEQSGPVAVPASLVDRVVAAIPGSEAHQLSIAAAPGPTAFMHWDVLDFTPASGTDAGDRDDYGFLSMYGAGVTGSASIADDTLLGLYSLPAEVDRVLDRDGIVLVAGGDLRGTAIVTLRDDAALVAADAAAAKRVIAAVKGGGVKPGEPDVPGGPGSPLPAPREVVGRLTVPVAGGGTSFGQAPRLLMTQAKAQSLGLVTAPGPTVVRSPRPLTSDQRNAVEFTVEEHGEDVYDAAMASGVAPVSVYHVMLYSTGGPSPLLVEVMLAGVALLLSLFVVAASLALAAAETRDERDVLAVVGAPPRAMRRSSGRKAAILTALGAAIAVPAGFLPVMVIVGVSDDDLPLVFPWRLVLLLIVAVPLVAGAVTTVASGLALRLRPVRVSTMAFD